MGDRAGLFPGVVHQWDGLHERLSLNFQLNTDHFDFRLYADDLSFSDDSEDAVLFSGNVLSFTLSRTWPVEIAFELFSALSYNDIGSSVFYPTLFIDAPIVNTDTLAFALRFGTLTRMEKFSLSELFKGESSFFFSIPFSIDDDEMSIGFYVQKEGVYYNLYNENYKPMVTDEDSIAFFFDADLNFDRFDLSINTFLNLSSPALSLINENSYLDVAVSFMIGNMDFLMGVRKQNLFEFDDFLATSDFYFGLGAKTGSIETELQLRYRNGHPEIGFSSSLAFIDIDNNVYEKERDGEIPIKLLFDLGFENYYNEGLFFKISPIIRIRPEEFELSFRIPLYLKLAEGSVELVSLKADPWFDMWQDNSTIRAVYDSLTDMFALIERISFGSGEDSIFFMRAERNETRNDIFFENYRSFDALSLDMGFNFRNLDFGLYIDDLEAPQIIDPYISFYPVDSQGFALSVSAPTELKMIDSRNFILRSFPGFTYTQPFLDERLRFSFFLYGESFARYEEGVPVETAVVYDFANMELYGYLLGGEFEWMEHNYSISLSGGIHSGRLYPNYFNAFSSLNPDMDRSIYAIDGLSYYAILESSVFFENINFLFKYSMPNIVSLAENRMNYKGDMLTFDLKFTLSNGVGMHVRLSKLDFLSSVEGLRDLGTYFDNSNTIYSASLTKDFDDMSLEVELSTVAIYEESQYMNSYHLRDVSPRLRINARIGF